MSNVTNVVFAGLGGQGVLKASDILADAVFLTGADVKKSEIHGMSQRGGSVTSDVRFGDAVFSPMIPTGGADYLVLIEPEQLDIVKGLLCPTGVLVSAADIDPDGLPNKRSLNVALLGRLSTHFDIPEDVWHDAIRRNLPEKLHALNFESFAFGRSPAV